jgi:hypothetical protein
MTDWGTRGRGIQFSIETKDAAVENKFIETSVPDPLTF